MEDHGLCDLCGAPATSMARDFAQYEGRFGYYEYYPVGELKRGCALHPVIGVQREETVLEFLLRTSTVDAS